LNLFKEYAMEYTQKGYSVIPDKSHTKQPHIRQWNAYCTRKPEIHEIEKWGNAFDNSNIAVCLGSASGIIAIDFDCVDPDIIKLVEGLFPPSPVEKIGSKGWTRFYRYMGEVSRVIKFNGEVVFEILSNNKKTTIPPSVHPNGKSYIWSDASLLDIDVNDLPEFPPFLCSHIESKLRTTYDQDVNYKGGNFKSASMGRNDTLKTECARLINNNVPLDKAIQELIKIDEEQHETPLFTDPSHQGHLEKFTSAGRFYFNILETINNRRHMDSKEYLIPLLESAVNETYAKEITGKKLQSEDCQKKSSLELPKPDGVLAVIQNYILENSFIKQEAFALSAALSLMAVLAGRKFEFEGVASNLYILNVAPSGSGKDAPQQRVKEILIRINAENLLGAGDYVSDASLMDSLEHSPVRLDIIDEAGGLLRSVNQGGATFNAKMADVLAELYTCSTSKFLGRAVAEGVKGSCIRPNVNLLCSTTPAGFTEGVSHRSIEKGLMGRFLVFLGDGKQEAQRIKKLSVVDNDTIARLKHWATFQPKESGTSVGSVTQVFYSLESNRGAAEELDKAFTYYDQLRRDSSSENELLPIISRLYQQILKVSMLHALSRCEIDSLPVIGKRDVIFARKVIDYYFDNMKSLVDNNIYRNKSEEQLVKLLRVIADAGVEGITKTQLYKKTRNIKKRERDEIIQNLLEGEQISIDLIKGKQHIRKRR